MDNPFRDIGIMVVAVLVCAWAWFTTKEAATRKYVLLWCVCLLVTGIAYIIGTSFDIPAAGAIGGLAFLGTIYFLIKYILSERKAKKKSSDD